MSGPASEPASEDPPHGIPAAPAPPPRRLIAKLRWSHHPETGWPVGHWTLSEAPPAEDSPPGSNR